MTGTTHTGRLLLVLIVLAMTITLLALGSTAAAQSVIAVPAGPGGSPQPSYNGTRTIFKAVARETNTDCGDRIREWSWRIGGSEETTTPAPPPSDPTSKTASKEQTLTPAPDGTTREGSVTAHYENGAEPSDDFQMIHKGVSREVDVEKSVLEGLWFLHQNQVRYDQSGKMFGYWGTPGSEIAPTARAILAFEVQGHLPSADWNDYAYAYAVERGLNHLLARLVAVPIDEQTAGDPDSNGNGIGLSYLGGEEMVDQPLALTAIAASLDPDRVATVGGPYVAGRTYHDIAQDMVDYIAWAQNEDPDPADLAPEGGWNTHANLLPSRNSISQHPILALLSAEENFGIAAPGWVKSQLGPWLSYSQNMEPGALRGGFGDTGPLDYPNIDKTAGAGLVGHAYLGTPSLDPRVTSAVDFIDANWNDPGGTGENLGNYIAMYSTQKGARTLRPELQNIGSHDWADEYADYLIANQEADGGWPAAAGTDRLDSTTLSCLVQTPSIFEPRPVALAGVDNAAPTLGEAVTFDASGSKSTNPSRGIAKYEWDFDGDGTFDYETTDPAERPTHTYTPDAGECPKSYLARLRVTEDGDRARADYDTVEVIVAQPPAPIPDILSISLTGPQPDGTIVVGDPVELRAEFTTQEDETYTATVNWGDGSPIETLTITQNSTATATGTHVFHQVLGFTVEIEVTGSLGGKDVDSAWETVSGGSLNIEVADTHVGTEGFKTDVPGTFKDTATRSHTATFDPGDGTGPQPATVTERQTNSMEGTVTAEHTYAQDGVYEATMCVTADDGTSATDTGTVTIANATPVITYFEPGSDPFEGQVAAFTGTVTDPGANDILTARVDWGDGTPESFFDVQACSLDTTHTYADDGTYTVTVTVTDDDGGTTTETSQVTVQNVAPDVTHFDPGSDPFEGQVATFTGTVTDPGVNDILTARVDWGDEEPESFFDVQACSLDTTHTYADDGTYTVTVTVEDDDGGTTTETSQVTVQNVPPAVELDPLPSPIFEGDLVQLTGTVTDPGVNDTIGARVIWGDGTPESFFDVTAGPLEGSHAYADDGTYIITVIVTDDAGDSTSVIMPVIVDIAPKILDTILTSPNPDGTIYEGDEVELRAFLEYPDSMTPTATILWGDGTPLEDGTITHNSTATAFFKHKFTDNGAGTAGIEVMFNPEGIAVKKSVDWTAENKPPKIEPKPSVEPSPPVEGGKTKIEVPFHDAGDDTHTATIDPGDGTGPKPATVTSKPSGSVDGTASIEHTYANDGPYTVTATVTDDDGGVGTATYLIAVQGVNTPPVANAGSDQTVHAGVPVTLDGSGSSDADGDDLTYSWHITSKPEGSAAALSDPTAVSPSLTIDLTGDYVVELIVNDGQADSDPDSVTISTTNSAPVAEAGPNQSAAVLGSTVQLAGNQSYDPDGDALTYEWTFASKPAASSAALSDPATVNPTFVADVHGDYVLQLVVRDGWCESVPDSMTVTFENVKPVADAGDSQSVVVGQEVTLDGSGSSDANGDSLTYAWSLTAVPQGSSAGLGDPDAPSTTFVPDLPGTYVAQLVVNDGFEASDPATVEIEVVSLPTAAIESAQVLQAQVAMLDPDAFKNDNMQHALANKINAVIAKIEAGDYEDALDKLEHDILKKTDGVANTGSPDKNDWIRDVEAQRIVYPCVMNLILNVQLLVSGQ